MEAWAEKADTKSLYAGEVMKKTLKGNVLSSIGPVALTLVIAIFIVSIGATMISNLQTTAICTDGTWATYNSSSAAVFPATGTYEGCCNEINASNPGDCETWDSDAAFNQTVGGLEGLAQFGDWWVVIVLAVILGIIVSVLYFYLGGSLGTRSGGY